MKSLRSKVNDPEFIARIKAIAKKDFEDHDENGDGWIDARELYHHMVSMHIKRKKEHPDISMSPPNRDKAKIQLNNFDKDKDGRLSIDEYTDMCILQIKSSILQVTD